MIDAHCKTLAFLHETRRRKHGWLVSERRRFTLGQRFNGSYYGNLRWRDLANVLPEFFVLHAIVATPFSKSR